MHAVGTGAVVRWGRVPLTLSQDRGAELETELLYGELVVVLDSVGSQCRVRNLRDGIEGFVAVEALEPGGISPTHRVDVLRTFVYAHADIKSPCRDRLHLGSAVQVVEQYQDLSRLACGGWVFTSHLGAFDALRLDPLAVAAEFLGVPYLWGGKSSIGLDCSGLVQMAMQACGLSAPRNSHQQQTALGRAVETIEKGDIVFWPGHVGFALNPTEVLHATAHVMQVAIEPLVQINQRVRAAEQQKGRVGRDVIAVRRL